MKTNLDKIKCQCLILCGSEFKIISDSSHEVNVENSKEYLLYFMIFEKAKQ